MSLLLFLFFFSSSSHVNTQLRGVRKTLLDLTDYSYPLKETDGEDYKICIFGTNDLHGFFLPVKETVDGVEYHFGGLDYLTGVADILKKEWKNRFIWLDAGDQFQGGMETQISKGFLMTDFFNTVGLAAATLGNHEFDYGREYIFSKLTGSHFPYVTANIFKANTNTNVLFPNQVTSTTLKVGKVSIGIIGAITLDTPASTKSDLTEYDFKDIKESIMKEAKDLRTKYKVNAVVLLSHAGLRCTNLPRHNGVLKLWDIENSKGICEAKGEIYDLLMALPKGTIDLVVGGHEHFNIQFFVNGVPVMSNVNNGKFVHVAYLSFDKNLNIISEKTIIEGPIPIRRKLYTDSTPSEERERNMFHDSEIKVNKTVSELISPYKNEIDSFLNDIIMTIPEDFHMERYEENPLGDFTADFVRDITGADIAVLNSGFFRTRWSKGGISKKQIHDMFPFDNKLVSFEMRGEEVMRAISLLQTGKKRFYQTSGLKQKIDSETKRIEIKLENGEEIEKEKVYKIGSIDFCVPNYGNDFKLIKEFYPNGKNLRYYGNFTDNLVNYLKSRKVNWEFYYDKKNSRLTVTR